MKKFIGSAKRARPGGRRLRGLSPRPRPPDDTLDEIIVTGTRSSVRTVTSSLAPIDVLPAGELIRSGKQSPRDLISTLVPSATTSNTGAGASFAVKTVSLRGLSADQVLVLVNGKRRHNTAILFVNGTTQNGQSPPDLDLIPSAGIDRIEVLRDGASAQYGSDALAGVVNLILKRQAERRRRSRPWPAATSRATARTGQLSGNVGVPLWETGGSFNLSVRRPLAATIPTAAVFALSGAACSIPRWPASRIRARTRSTAASTTPASRRSRWATVGYDLSVPIAEDQEFYAFGTYTNRKSRAWLTPRLPGNAANHIVRSIPTAIRPSLHAAGRGLSSTPAGFKGKSWPASTTTCRPPGQRGHGRLQRGLAERLARAGRARSPSISARWRFTEWTSNFDLTRELHDRRVRPKPLFLALGAEYRENKLEHRRRRARLLYRRPLSGARRPAQRRDHHPGGRAGRHRLPAVLGRGVQAHTTSRLYANGEQSITSNWDVSAAARYEHYSDFGDADTYKASTRYEPIKGYAIRATASTGFRAPSLQQQHYASASTIGRAAAGRPDHQPLSGPAPAARHGCGPGAWGPSR